MGALVWVWTVPTGLCAGGFVSRLTGRWWGLRRQGPWEVLWPLGHVLRGPGLPLLLSSLAVKGGSTPPGAPGLGAGSHRPRAMGWRCPSGTPETLRVPVSQECSQSAGPSVMEFLRPWVLLLCAVWPYTLGDIKGWRSRGARRLQSDNLLRPAQSTHLLSCPPYAPAPRVPAMAMLPAAWTSRAHPLLIPRPVPCDVSPGGLQPSFWKPGWPSPAISQSTLPRS